MSQAVEVDGRAVGAVMLRFPVADMGPERHVRDALSRAALKGILIAVLVALIVAVYVSARVTRPVTALTNAAGGLAAGRRDTRVNLTKAPGELRTLADAFNEMADNLDREDQLRRNLLADVAHELRTPLTILQGNTEAILTASTSQHRRRSPRSTTKSCDCGDSWPISKPLPLPKPPDCGCAACPSTLPTPRGRAPTCSDRSPRERHQHQHRR